VPLTEVDDYAENILAQHISQISGVASVEIAGQQKPSVRIQVDPVKVASFGLSLEDLRGVIVNATTVSPMGTVDGKTRTFTIYGNGQMLKAAPGTTSSSPTRTAPLYGSATSAAPSTHRKISASRLSPTASKRFCCRFSNCRAPTSSRPWTASRPLCRSSRRDPADGQAQVLSDRTQTIRASVADVQFS